VHDLLATELENDLARLEVGIKRLKVQYDMFFAGSIPRQPFELRNEIEKIIRHHTRNPIRKYAYRFHFNALVSRFNSMSELWAKTLRALEEGDRPAPAVADRAGSGEQLVAQCTVLDPTHEQGNLKLFHARLLDARKKAGDGPGTLPFDTFLRSISTQAAKLREKTGCDKVELRVIIHDRKVAVRARPGR
jgi:hypothetical protein